MDIAILAGGYGTRLKGVWDKAKCLVPYQGRPLIEHLVEKAFDLCPRKIFLLLGHKAWQMVEWYENCYPHRRRDILLIIEATPSGTASALRKALPQMEAPLLVLNGDTIPLYDFHGMLQLASTNQNQAQATVSWSNEAYAGACVLYATGINHLLSSVEPDFNYFVTYPLNQKFHVPGFIDVGTPEGLKQAWRDAALTGVK